MKRRLTWFKRKKLLEIHVSNKENGIRNKIEGVRNLRNINNRRGDISVE